ncbi:MAG: translation initiation factor IF-3 [Flavobacteriia bacterium]|jgi:translation initiation factor IF-3|nr:translation initiation factor IF-3 [Flavobacteriia bacterium]NBV68484.1 translation initiation factor IF-3 [Flavobacteriia bacterium]NBV92151.1 translation initiation factor IF-3 [Flavobacteriia bacterium]NBY40273.1 translation initiation factor IF-3 [Flavobacteriia bacterium]
MRRNPRHQPRKEEVALHRINDKIIATEIRLILEGEEPVVMSVSKALLMAEQQELDLVEISPNAKIPVCKILDYKKFLYNQKRKQKELKAKQSKIVVKEIRFGPNTDDHDFNFKLAHARKFLEEGSKVKAYVFFRGRTIVFKDRGEILLLKFAQELADVGVVEQLPKLEGKKMILMINAKKK